MTHIQVTNNSIEIKGHAGYDNPGKDIVCAAISTLTFTFLNYCELTKKLIHKEMDDDRIFIVHNAPVDMIVTGFKMLSESYPDFVIINDARERP